ncbi:MAG: hypothetical protein AAB772_00770, partial [Patescibacteria group bacterium]
FTLFEMLVTMSIMSFLAATLIIYSHIGEKQIVLFKEQARVLSLLTRARNLGITSFIKAGANPLPCGYGAHFETPRTMIIFEDRAINPDCSDADRRYSGPAEVFESSTLDSAVFFSALTLSDVAFVPPQPLVFITPSQDQAVITLTTSGSNPVSASVTVSTANQISVQ